MFHHVHIKPVTGLFRTDNQSFRMELKAAVDAYFKDNHMSRFASAGFWIRAILMVVLYAGSYFSILFIHPTGWPAILLCVTMGLGLSGIGFAISHQAAHGAISSNDRLNRIMSMSFNLVGMSDYMWHLKHDVFHHSYTNVFEWDEALKEDETFRFSEQARWLPKHRYQHIYGFFTYGIFTIAWALWLDIDKWVRYKNFIEGEKHPVVERWIFWITKILYLLTMFAVPLWAGYSIGAILSGYLIMNFVGSSLITHVLQVEHLNEKTFRAENAAGVKELSWSENQLLGTSNFKTGGLFNWYIAGVNHQIEHHLFPQINAVHYPALGKIIKPIAEKHGLSYTEFPSFTLAIASHYRLLRELGRKPGEVNRAAVV